ncbi:cytochrome c3 family protein [Shewanella schlegeliana]|uniref:Cytochrome c3 family protein n=1 Tax=Shewanella schlegeliana TaxID=190308 RepID=A0ABS1T2G6_9GAMM|nr:MULTISPECIES: cytochrome c3 family protein [Shewanella]MBL4914981.1 cytochrome c3 family protein [Shewanella schlegeliana]MCG9730380.1 cytochrome c3 family protein [Shewanella sp. Isolate13]MCL1110607.1 cytochrome c3 family protein [Shewanella schlegeliana]GIU17923.1 cytochrome c [Shewanella sp. MBTL60-007]GIU32133.1 cytochrome c [Shewanella schlegeliana]
MNKLLLSALLGLALSSNVMAGELVKMKGKTEGRINHEFIYQDGCQTCHQGSGKKNATDAACVECHGDINSIPVDESKLAIPEAHPHKSLHYNQGASCLACHAEHEKKAPVCTECHRTWFEEM